MELKAGDIGKVYRVVHSGKRPAQLWGDGATSVDGWNGQRDLDVDTELRFVKMKPGDWGPDVPVFEDIATGKKGYFSPSYGLSGRGTPGMPLKGWLKLSKKMNKVTLAEALGLAKPAKKLSRKNLRNLILSEIRILAEQDKEDKGKDDASTISDEEAVKAIEDNIPGKGVTDVVDFLNSPLGTDPKVREFIRKGSEDGDPSDEQITVGSGSPKVGNMVPTQNEIDLMKSISFPLSSIDALDNAMGSSVAIGDIIASGEHIIDGHHRWSSVASVNPDASLKVIDLGLPGSADTKLAVAQVAIAAQPKVGTKPVPKATTAGAANNILGKSAGAIKEMILARVGESSEAGELLNDEIVNHIKTKYANKFGIGEGDDMETVREKIANTVGKNLAAMKAGEGPERAYMPQFTGGDTGPSLDARDVMGTLSRGDANYKEPIKQEAKRQYGVILERWQKLAGLLQD